MFKNTYHATFHRKLLLKSARGKGRQTFCMGGGAQCSDDVIKSMQKKVLKKLDVMLVVALTQS